jgi:hypothetical protein
MRNLPSRVYLLFVLASPVADNTSLCCLIVDPRSIHRLAMFSNNQPLPRLSSRPLFLPPSSLKIFCHRIFDGSKCRRLGQVPSVLIGFVRSRHCDQGDWLSTSTAPCSCSAWSRVVLHGVVYVSTRTWSLGFRAQGLGQDMCNFSDSMFYMCTCRLLMRLRFETDYHQTTATTPVC